MKKKLLFLVIPLVILCFVILFSMASEKTRKRNAEIAQIHHSAKVAIGDYLKGETVKTVSFNTLPVYYGTDRCIIGCRVLSVDEYGTKHLTGFDCLLHRKKKTWVAAIVTIEKNLPFSKETTKPASFDALFKPAGKGR